MSCPFPGMHPSDEEREERRAFIKFVNDYLAERGCCAVVAGVAQDAVSIQHTWDMPLDRVNTLVNDAIAVYNKLKELRK